MSVKKKTVMVIDDDPDFRNYVKAILEVKGIEVSEAASLVEAAKVLAERRPNIILLDMELGGERGNQFLLERSIQPALAKIPVIVCSSQNLATIVKEAIRYGADDYLIKPIKQTWLMQRIRKHLINEVEMSYSFDENVDVEMALEALPVSVSDESFLARSQLGFGKGVIVQASIADHENNVDVYYFRSIEKSKYSSKGPFDTMFSEAGITQSERDRLKMLKTFWRT